MECTGVFASSPEFSPEAQGHRLNTVLGLRPCPKPPALGTSEVGEDVVRHLGHRRRPANMMLARGLHAHRRLQVKQLK